MSDAYTTYNATGPGGEPGVAIERHESAGGGVRWASREQFGEAWDRYLRAAGLAADQEILDAALHLFWCECEEPSNSPQPPHAPPRATITLELQHNGDVDLCARYSPVVRVGLEGHMLPLVQVVDRMFAAVCDEVDGPPGLGEGGTP